MEGWSAKWKDGVGIDRQVEGPGVHLTDAASMTTRATAGPLELAVLLKQLTKMARNQRFYRASG